MLTVQDLAGSIAFSKRSHAPSPRAVAASEVSASPQVSDQIQLSGASSAQAAPTVAKQATQQPVQAPSTPSIEVNAQHAATVAAVAAALAARLEVASDQVTLSGFEPQKGFNAGNSGFPVNGELQVSAWTQGLEMIFQNQGHSYVYRGLDAAAGRYGQDSEHKGYWQQDERGIYVPDLSVPSSEDFW